MTELPVSMMVGLWIVVSVRLKEATALLPVSMNEVVSLSVTDRLTRIIQDVIK